MAEAATEGVLWKKVFLEISPQACNFIKKETLTQMFSYEFCEFFNNTFFIEHLQETAFVMTQWLRKGLSLNFDPYKGHTGIANPLNQIDFNKQQQEVDKLTLGKLIYNNTLILRGFIVLVPFPFT